MSILFGYGGGVINHDTEAAGSTLDFGTAEHEIFIAGREGANQNILTMSAEGRDSGRRGQAPLRRVAAACAASKNGACVRSRFS
jgi:hypothetical protein